MKKLKALFAVAFMAAALGISGCQQEAQVSEKPKAQVIQAQVDEVQLGTIPLTAVVPGTVVPDQRARIASRLMGYIKDLRVEVGQSVKRGEVLFKIDSSDIRSQITQAQAGYQQAQAALTDAKLDFDRFEKLFKDDSVSKQQFDKIRLQYSVAQENLAAAKSGLDQARSQLRYANVTAPFSGVVVEKMAVAGDLAAPGNPILSIENLSSLSVQTEVSGELFAKLRNGDTAKVLVDGQPEAMVGTIYTLVGAADPRSRTHTVKLSLPAVSTINSGTFARVSFTRGERQTLMIPKSAVVTRAGIDGVFVVDEGKAFFHMVRTGVEINGDIEVQSGLALGDKIVIDNNQSLLNGDTVKTTNNSSENASTEQGA
ncbi:efflux RND transporter periplasmic adaptor subunit [Thiomicrorhabdus indica]|uniref:efflux RND transporter periplasmic adaptor subunit n=1 Tax=Thiomicrorhabdus indica TaxID=2267253 RepID=UPI00102E089C|nr:efflux RND transporter periplasmic adaptor subunit [Thiomicrorhabdus indica]